MCGKQRELLASAGKKPCRLARFTSRINAFARIKPSRGSSGSGQIIQRKTDPFPKNWATFRGIGQSSDGNDFCAGCTLGEVYLLQGDINSAAGKYQKVIDKHSSRTGDLAGTRQQATRICRALQLSDEKTKTVCALFELLE